MASDSPVQALSITPKLQLYSVCTSSCSWRVRIALNLKGLPYEYKEINLMTQFSPGEVSKVLHKIWPVNVKGPHAIWISTEFSRCSPMNYVPALVDGDIFLSDSFAIILYLEEKYPQQPLLPRDPLQKSINLQAANIVCSNIQPLQNNSAANFIEEKCGPEEKIEWIKYHIGKGFEALEKLLKDYSRTYATGDEIFLADLFLAPQIDVAINRYKFDMSQLPLLSRLHEAYKEIPAFQAARPEMQPDYVKR